MTTPDPKAHQLLAGLAQQAAYAHDFAKAGHETEALEHAAAVERLIAAWRLAAGHATPEPSGRELADLVRDLAHSDPCEIDHNGGCQAHWWSPGDGTPCPHGRAQALFPAIKEA